MRKSPKVKSSWTRWLPLAPAASVVWLCLGPEGSGVASRLHRQSLVPSPEVFLEFEHPEGNPDKELARLSVSW